MSQTIFPRGKSALTTVRKYFNDIKTVTEGAHDLHVNVSTSDSKRAQKYPREPDRCAIALALERDGHDGAVVGTSVVYVINGKTATRYKLPISVQKEIVSIDRSGLFAPGEYVLKAPHPSATLAAVRENARNAKKDRSKPKKHMFHRTEMVRKL